MGRAGLDPLQRPLQIVERAAATRAGDVLGPRHPRPGRLQDRQLDPLDLGLRKAGRHDADAVGQSVEKEQSQIGRRLHGDRLGRGVLVAAAHGHRLAVVEVEDRGAQLGRGVGRQGLQLAESGRKLAVDERGLHGAATAVFGRGVTLRTAHFEAAFAAAEVVGEQLRHGYFVFGSFGERDADRVADAVGQQRPDAHGALHPSFESVAGLRHPKMDRVVHPLGLHRLREQAVGGDHHARVARFHRDHDLIEAEPAAFAQILHRRDHHSLRGVAPPVEDALRERPVVHADADRRAVGAAQLHERRELSAVVAVVARVDAHLVRVLRRHGRRLRQEVDVGHERRVAPQLAHAAGDVSQVLRFARSLRREAHDAGARAGDAHDLRRAGLRVVGVGVGHRLHGHGPAAADHDAADPHLRGRTASVLRQIHEQIDPLCFP